MGILWVVLFVALIGSHTGHGLPVRLTPQTYPHDASGTSLFEGWGSESGLYAALLAVALVLTAVGLLLGCTWCYRHKDCKLFTASATHLHDGRRSHPPDSGFSEPVNNNISEDNNNGPISLREMQNIANNNAATYIVSENEERNRVSRESVVEFEPLPSGIRVADPLERCADWFGGEDLPRSQLQYLREIGRGWFGRVVEGELDDGGETTSVAVKILNQNATLEDKARFLDESRVYRDTRHENILAFVAKCLQEDPWILLFELCSMDLQQYLIMNRPKMAILNESGVPLQLMCDVTSALAYLHSRGYIYGNLWCGNVLVRGNAENVRAVLGRYVDVEPRHDFNAPETRRHPSSYTTSSEVWSLGALVWEVCAWGAPPPPPPLPPPDLPCPYRNHLYQVMQLCWHANPEARPTSAQVHALLNHLHTTHAHANDATHDDGYGSSDFEERWQRLKPNTIPKIDEHVAIVHAPSTSMASHFTGSDQEFDNVQTVQDTLSVDMDTAVSRSSSIMSDKDPLSIQVKSESLTNLHGSLEDVRNIYLTHNETAALECHQANIGLDDREKEHDRSDSSVDPWLKDIIAGSQDDVSYYKDVSDVIKNLDNILNSEKTSSSESSHQASPSRDNLSLDCKKDYPIQSCLVKSPGITNFQNILEMGFEAKPEETEICEEDDVDRDTIGTLSHSFERHSDTISQQTLENLTPDTPIKDIEAVCIVEDNNEAKDSEKNDSSAGNKEEIEESLHQEKKRPNKSKLDVSDNKFPTLRELCVASIPSVSETKIEGSIVREDCKPLCDNKLEEVVRTDIVIETNSRSDSNVKTEEYLNATPIDVNKPIRTVEKCVDEIILPKLINENAFVNDDIHVHEENTLFQTKSDTVSIQKSDLLDTNKIESAESVSNLTDKPDLQKNVDFFCNTAHNDKIYESNPLLSNSIHSVAAADNEINIKASDLISSVIETDDSTDVLANEMNKIGKDDGTLITEKFDPISTSFIQCTPEQVQNLVYNTSILQTTLSPEFVTCETVFPPEIVQNISEKGEISKPQYTFVITEEKENVRSDSNDMANEPVMKESTDDSTVYIDLANSTNNEIKNEKLVDNNLKSVIDSCLQLSNDESNYSLIKNESTVYLDLPNVIQETGNFLHSEKVISSQILDFISNISASTPKDSNVSADQNLTEKEFKGNENDIVSEPKVPDYGPTVTLTKLEQRYVPDSMSPFESPTKSHHTDTYDENSSVVLGPFENCTLELFKGAKSTELVDLPKEELLAFSSNFSEMNLETPSPLRDGNFLNEVPDIIHDDLHFDDIQSVSEAKPEKTDNTDDTDLQFTEKRVSPSTPPNSPGNFLASTSQQKYLVDIDLNPPTETPHEPDSVLSSLQKEIDLNQIELQITTKLAMAENENNMNIEYSGPLTVEGLVSENASLMHDSDSMPETYLAGNGDAGASSLDELRQGLTLDEECVKALRNELELKLPLAQVAAIEPQCEAEAEGSGAAWAGELPPPPELVVAYVGALSPIAEETGPQLTAYENDTHWNASIRTDSSESYPEPCNNSTDDVTDLLTGAQSGPQDHSIEHTYTIHSRDHSPNQTHTVHRDVTTSKEMTMSADSLNANSLNKAQKETKSPVDDRTYIINDDEKVSGCERISQVSPFMLSPTTDTSAPDNSDNVTGVSTLSKTTLPTDAKLSKPSETQCLSKATSIDSWCSNDTLYNVEENFDDLAMDPDLPEFVPEKEDNSISSHTLTHDDEKELSHCSTYIVHDSKSEAHESFSPDSITANENHTYTKVKTDAVGTSPSAMTKSDINDSTRNTQTKDLAYGTLMSGLPSYSNCTTEAISAGDDAWKYAQPELVRKTPNPMEDIHFSPPKVAEGQDSVDNISTPLPPSPCVKKMDSIEISCLEGNLSHACNKSNGSDEQALIPIEVNDSPQYKHMAHSITSTPIVQPSAEDDNIETIPMHLPDKTERPEYYLNNIPNIQTFLQSAELKPQDISSNISNECVDTNLNTEVLLEGESETISRNSNKDNAAISASYAAFENSVITKPQDVHSNETSSQRFETEMGSEQYQEYHDEVENSETPWSGIDASSLLLKSERNSSELAMSRSMNVAVDRIEEAVIGEGNERNAQSLVLSPPSVTNLNESRNINKGKETTDILMTDLDNDEETEQPHSIIITDSFKCVTNESISHSETQILESNDSRKHLNISKTTVENAPENENITSESMQLSEVKNESQESAMNSLPNFQTFVQSAELRPQDVSSVPNSERYDIKNTTNETIASEQSTGYVDFEHSVVSKPQDLQSKQSSQSFETDEFRQFENSVKNRPQDLSSLINASSLLLKSEIKFCEFGISSANNTHAKTSQLANQAIEESSPSLDINPPSVTNLKESHELKNITQPVNNFLVDLDEPDETDQPHSIIITDSSKYYISEEQSPNETYNSHIQIEENNRTYDSHTNKYELTETDNIKIKNEDITEGPKVNGVDEEHTLIQPIEHKSPKVENKEEFTGTFLPTNVVTNTYLTENIPNGSLSEDNKQVIENILYDKNGEKYATVNFINEAFEELMESNVDDGDSKDAKISNEEKTLINQEKIEDEISKETDNSTASEINKSTIIEPLVNVSENIDEHSAKIVENISSNSIPNIEENKMTSVTEHFLQNEKKFCQLDSYLPLLSDIRFTGPAAEIMSTSFTNESPTEPRPPETDQQTTNLVDTAADILKDWDSDSDSHSSNSSSGEFIWKQRGSGSQAGSGSGSGAAEGASEGSGDSGSEGDEVEFVPSSWDCRAAPSKSSLRSLEQAPPDNKKRVVFKRQKYHCVYEYPREAPDIDLDSPAGYAPDFSTYSDWESCSAGAREAEAGYGRLFGAALDLYPLRAAALSPDYDEDFFISSSARPFESLGIMSTTSQFFPGMNFKQALLDREIADEVGEEFPPPPSPLPATTLTQTRTPSLDFTTPDSGVEDITPGSTTTEEDFKTKKLPESEITQFWKPVDSGSSSESVSPSSPGGEALGGLRHTRDKLKLDLPPSPHIPSPRHNRVFNFVLDKPKRHRPVEEKPSEISSTPLVMTDETPIITTTLPLEKDCEDVPVPEPTFSTFGKSTQRNVEPEQKGIILTDGDDAQDISEDKEDSPKVVEAVKGEGTVLDSGDEDSGIESSSKATLERNKTPNVS